MNDTVPRSEAELAEHRQGERGKVMAIWVLYIAALFSAGLSLIVGAVLAYVFRGEARGHLRSHYDKQVSVFWWGVFWALVGGGLVAVGGPLSFVIVGIPFLLLGLAVLGLSWLWVLVVSIRGLARVNDGRPY